MRKISGRFVISTRLVIQHAAGKPSWLIDLTLGFAWGEAITDESYDTYDCSQSMTLFYK